MVGGEALANQVRMGGMRITPVVTSRFRLDGGSMFGVIPKVLWQDKAPADEMNRIDLNVNTLVIETEGHVIVIEPGMGSKYDEKQRGIYALDSLDTESALADAGIDPAGVDMVVPTHLHLDHAGGSTSYREQGDPESCFPNARFVVQEAELQAAIAPGPLERGSYNPDDYVPLQASGDLEVVSGDCEIAPGVSVELTGGHTRGHQVVRFKSEGEEGLFLGDIVPTLAHLKLNWLMAWDLEPQVVFEQKERLLSDAAARGVTCFFPHDPRVVGCRLEAGSKGSFQPVPDTIIEAI